MISFRFYLVSLVAVFMALGVGVLTGTTVINRGVVARLESQTEALEANSNTLREELRRLQVEAEIWEEAVPLILSGRLAGRQIVLLSQDGTSEETLAGVRRALETAGAQILASLTIGPRMALATEPDQQALATLLGMATTEEPETIRVEAARATAARLAEGPDGSEILEGLLNEEFLVIQGTGLTQTGLRGLGGPDQVVVAVAGGPAPSELAPDDFLVPLVSALARSGVPVLAAEPAEGEDGEPPFVTTLRADTDIAPLIATQDNVDQLPGQVGLALALEGLLLGEPGHYGVKEGSSQFLPDLT